MDRQGIRYLEENGIKVHLFDRDLQEQIREANEKFIAEALKRGLPVLVCGGGAAGALVTGGSGHVCPVGDYHELAKSLRRLIVDPELRQAMAEHAWQTGQTLPSWRDQAALFAASLG